MNGLVEQRAANLGSANRLYEQCKRATIPINNPYKYRETWYEVSIT